MKSLSQTIIRSGFILSILPLVLLVLAGTAVYAWLEGWSLIDALYATVITVTTIGYGDLAPLTSAGRLFSVFFTIAAVGFAGYAISTLAVIVIEYQMNRKQRTIEERRMKRIADLKAHFIVCGGTVFGHRVANEFYKRKASFILVEPDEEKLKTALLWINSEYIRKMIEQFEYRTDEFLLGEEEEKSAAELADEMGVLYLLEDPTSEQSLLRAGLSRAQGLVTAMDDDRDNVSIILSARDMAPKLGNSALRVVSRAADEANIRRIYLAGADKVTMPNFVGGFQLAMHMLSPVVGEFWEHMLLPNEELKRFADFSIAEHPQFIGLTPAALKEKHNQLVIAIKRNGDFHYAPDMDEKLEEQDVLIVLGIPITP